MPNNQAHVKQLVRKLLMDASGVTTLLGSGGAVFTDHPRTPDNRSIQMPLLIVDTQGGTGGYQGAIAATAFHLYAYSRVSQDEADTLYHAAYTALQAERLYDATQSNGSPVISAAGYVRETGRPDSGYNADVDAWYARGAWLAMTAG